MKCMGRLAGHIRPKVVTFPRPGASRSYAPRLPFLVMYPQSSFWFLTFACYDFHGVLSFIFCISYNDGFVSNNFWSVSKDTRFMLIYINCVVKCMFWSSLLLSTCSHLKFRQCFDGTLNDLLICQLSQSSLYTCSMETQAKFSAYCLTIGKGNLAGCGKTSNMSNGEIRENYTLVHSTT
jgi:hypothetical protein